MGGAHSPPRRGGVARSAGVVSSAKRCAGLTAPSAPLRWLRYILLMAQPPLLCEEGNIMNSTSLIGHPNIGHLRKIHDLTSAYVRVLIVSSCRVNHEAPSVSDWN